MGKLDTSRMTNATKVGRVDNAHGELENDLGEILGVPDNTIITNPIFGVTTDGSRPVNADGTITGVQRFVMPSASADPGSCVGFEFADGTETKRLIFVNSGLKIYREGDSSWELVADIENPGSGSGLLANLADVDPTLVMAADKVLGTNSLGTLFELQDPAAGTGKSRFADLTDTPAAAAGAPFETANVGQLVYVASEDTLGFQDAPAGLGAPFVMMLQAPIAGTTSRWGNGGWIDLYEWDYASITDPNNLLTTDAGLLVDLGGSKVRKYITLEAGVYDINFWYNTTSQTVWGLREWRVQGSNSAGPATLGAAQHPKVAFLPGVSDIGAVQGVHSLGSKMLLQNADDEIYLQVSQTSKLNPMTGNTFFATICRVK